MIGVGWSDDLGGMGAGYAAALGGTLIERTGPEDDPTSRAVVRLLAREGIDHQPIRVPDHAADWTLLVTSGEHGDKLPIGFRGCHAALELGIVRAFPRRVLRPAGRGRGAEPAGGPLLSAPGARCRLFAPAMRNMRDREFPVSRFAGSIDLLCCNRQ